MTLVPVFRVLILLSLLFGGCGNMLNFGGKFRANYTKREARIPMRDGTHLFTAIYTPKDGRQKYPILMTRTPYGVGDYGPNKFPDLSGNSFAENGFILVFQDVRGRYESEGEFVEERPVKDVLAGPQDVDETTDTYDTIEWLLQNVPNNNGKVGLKGISYSGFYTSSGMIRSHPALVAASPQAPMADLFHGDDAYHNGALLLEQNFSFYTGFGPQHNPQADDKEEDYNYGTKDGYAFYLRKGSLRNLQGNPYWTDVKTHATYDEYWKSRNILPHLKQIAPAVLVVGGWFDAEDLSGTLKTFSSIKAQSPSTTVRFVMGPWSHGQWARDPGTHLGRVQFGSATGEFFRKQIELPFFLHYLKGASDPTLPTASVFETGKNVWRKESEWPPKRAVPQFLYLREGKQLSFDKPDEVAGFDEYRSDPSNPVPFSAEPVLEAPTEFMVADQRFVANRPDVLVYQTSALERDLTIAGPVRPELTVSSTGTDSDFVVKLIDVRPDGFQQLIRGEPFRAKFRNSSEIPEPISPNVPTGLQFSMPDVYHCFLKGHRVMIQIQSSWFPLVDRNPQIFTQIPQARESDFRPATERVYRSRDAASAIRLNVLP